MFALQCASVFNEFAYLKLLLFVKYESHIGLMGDFLPYCILVIFFFISGNCLLTPDDVGYCRTSLNFWCSLFVIIFYFNCHYFVFSILPGIYVESYYAYE